MLTLSRLVLRNVAYHWRGNFAVLLGVAVGSAVLTGALLVGDSLRGSLRSRVERQLGGIDAAAILHRPIRADIAAELPGQTTPVLLLPGSIQVATTDDATAPYLGRVTVLGVDDRFKPEGISAGTVDWNGTARQIVVSERVARKLAVKAGERLKLGVERLSDLPRSSSLAKRDSSDVTATMELTVAAILPGASSGNDFNLTPNPAAPLNVFVPLRTLARLVSGDPEPIANTLLSSGAELNELNASLRDRLKPEDYGLKFRSIDRKGYVSVESNLLILPPTTVATIEASAKELGLHAEPTIAYIADTISSGDKSIPYPVVAGLNPGAAPPLGPFLPPDVTSLADYEIVLLEWNGSPLNRLSVGSKLRMDYFDPEVEGDGKLKSAELTLRGYVRLAKAAQDRDLVPEIRGVTDPRANLYDWDRPPVLPKQKIRERVPDRSPRAEFFNKEKATPMAYVNFATGKKLFGSRYGSVTSIRIAPRAGESLEETEVRLRAVLRKHLDPQTSGLSFQPIRRV